MPSSCTRRNAHRLPDGRVVGSRRRSTGTVGHGHGRYRRRQMTATGRRCRIEASRPRRCPGWRRGPSRPGRDGRGRRSGHRRRPPPRRAGRHRHRQVPRLPRARHPVGPTGRRGHRHQGAAGPARRQGPAVPRRAPRPAVRLRGAQGPLELRLPPAAGRDLTATPSCALDGLAQRASPSELGAWLQSWALDHGTGDRAELDFEPSPQAWAAVSVVVRGVPGRPALPAGRRRASPSRPGGGPPRPTSSWSTPTSTASTSRAGGAILPEHDVVVFDEAHQLEDIVSDTFGLELGAGRFTNLARIGPRGRRGADAASTTSRGPAACLADALADHVGRRLPGALDPDLVPVAHAGARPARPASWPRCGRSPTRTSATLDAPQGTGP